MENLDNIKYFKVNASVSILIEAFNEGEASYNTDSTMASIKGQTDYTINNISETTKEEYNSLIESNLFFESDESIVLEKWNFEFGDRNPTDIEKFEFYHNMRNAGFNSQLFHNGKLNDKMFSKEK